jgi:uncharacterized protein YcbX/endonuclease/exonuclease/phosphatase family metal-dependent hydrolase
VNGTLVGLARWPVKSLGGEPLRAGRLGARGLGGDRTHALLDRRQGREGRWVTVRQAPRLLAWSAAYPDAPDDALDPAAPPRPRLRGPDGTVWGWDQPGLAEALAADLGLAVRLHRDPGGQQDLEGSVLVTTEASRRAVETALGRPVELRRFRANLHLDLDAPAFAEERWDGGRLRVGEVTLALLNPCIRCVIPTRDPDGPGRWPELLRWLHRERGALFGVNARVLTGGRVGLGDPVTVEQPPGPPPEPLHRLGRGSPRLLVRRSLRVASWNIFTGRTWDGARVDLDLTLALLRRLDADLVALQEVDRDQPRSGRTDQARRLAEALAMTWVYAPALLGTPDGWRPPEAGRPDPGGPAYGIALLSRLPLDREETLPRPQAGRDEPRVAIVAELAGAGRRLTVAGTHLSNVPGPNLGQLRALQRHLDQAGGPRLLLGDLNLCWPVVRLASRPGWRPLVHGGTFRNRPPGSWRPLVQLDHVLAAGTDPTLHPRTTRILGGPASDHRAVLVELEWC